MTDKPDYSHDSGAIKDVANNDMPAIADDIGNTRGLFGGTRGRTSEAFNGPTPSFFDLSSFEGSPFAVLMDKWQKASFDISSGLADSRERVERAALALLRIADNYDEVEVQNAANIGKLRRFGRNQ